MDISVIICTYNRGESLKNTLLSVNNLSNGHTFSWELLIVDNNSKDDTKEIIERFIKETPFECRYIYERQQGLSYARNRGVLEAQGEILVFTDDDVTVQGDWLENIYKIFSEENPACLGGKIIPEWEIPPPTWLKGDLLSLLAVTHIGDEQLVLDTVHIWGANLSIRKDMFKKYGTFDEKLGHKGSRLFGGEEVAFIEKLILHGEKVLYSPEAVVIHHIPAERMEKSYFRKWMFDKGSMKGYLLRQNSKRNLFGVPLYVYKNLVQKSLNCAWALITRNLESFKKELSLYYSYGMFSGSRSWGKGNNEDFSDL